MKLPTVIYFYPENWGAVDRFAHLYGGTYTFPAHVRGCVSGTSSHFRRAYILRGLALSMAPSMEDDDRELQTKGFSHASRSREVTAVVESSITSLYSSIDAARKVFTHIFQKYQGIPDSTRKTFQYAKDGKIDERVPEAIQAAFRDADWYPRVRRLRDALTHVGPGSCHLDRETKKVMYFHDAIREGMAVMHIPDIFATIDSYFDSVNRFLGQLFAALLATLKDDEVWQMCGVFSGLIYSRYVKPSETKDFHSGRCDAHTWFDQPGKQRCPFVDKCDAYKRKKGA